MNEREQIASRAAKEIKDGMVVNLGIGLPTLIPSFLADDINIVLQSENGVLGMGEAALEGEGDPNAVNSGGKRINIHPGACFFDSCTSFGIIRGGHVDITILGALQVDASGSLASHIIPGKMVPGMGGAMDLVTGSKRVVVVTTHQAKENQPKILKKLTLPATAVGKVNLIITEMAVIEVTDAGLVLKEVTPGFTVEDVIAATQAELIVKINQSM